MNVVGKGGQLVDRGDNSYGGKYVINPSGGLISKGHPLGATGMSTVNHLDLSLTDDAYLSVHISGLAQCTELCLQLRGECGKRQVPGARIALQHNLGLGGAVIIGLYQLGFPHRR